VCRAPYLAGLVLAVWLGLGGGGLGWAQPDPSWLAHDRTRPAPPPVDPGTGSIVAEPGRPPSDAIVLFGGSDLVGWCALDGSATRWVVKDGAMECVPGSGYIRTMQAFGDCQLHLEFATPAHVEGEGQGRGNSGVFFGLNRYEIQVLDSYENPTYADGSAGAVYIQYPPLVNASRPPGQWQSFDIVWTAPRFGADGQLLSKAWVTAFHNGVLVHLNVELTGPTGWLTRAPYRAHPEKLPIALQDHGNPVRFRNIWVRELGKPGKPEFTFSEAALRRFVGEYDRGRNELVRVEPAGDGLLRFTVQGATFDLFAEGPSRFFAKTTDIQCQFETDPQGAVTGLVFSVGEGGIRAKKLK